MFDFEGNSSKRTEKGLKYSGNNSLNGDILSNSIIEKMRSSHSQHLPSNRQAAVVTNKVISDKDHKSKPTIDKEKVKEKVPITFNPSNIK